MFTLKFFILYRFLSFPVVIVNISEARAISSKWMWKSLFFPFRQSSATNLLYILNHQVLLHDRVILIKFSSVYLQSKSINWTCARHRNRTLFETDFVCLVLQLLNMCRWSITNASWLIIWIGKCRCPRVTRKTKSEKRRLVKVLT